MHGPEAVLVHGAPHHGQRNGTERAVARRSSATVGSPQRANVN
jgi:hypothetical protein